MMGQVRSSENLLSQLGLLIIRTSAFCLSFIWERTGAFSKGSIPLTKLGVLWGSVNMLSYLNFVFM